MNRKAYLRFFSFFLFLTAPVLTFPFMKNYVDSGNYENRQFTERPKLSLKTLTTFPSQYDAYFSDYLPYKNQLVMLNNKKDTSLGAGTTLIEYRCFMERLWKRNSL